MATAKINIKSIDYFKFKKIVIDGNRDDYGSCSKEVKALCDSVQTLSFRDEEFDVQSDRGRFEEVCTYYHQILQSKRIDPIDMRIKSGWWGDHRTGYSAGKIKASVLLEVLVAKTRDWAARHGGVQASVLDKIEQRIEGPGLFVFKHKEHQCFQYIGRADNVFSRCAELLRTAFEASVTEPLAALLVITTSTDWDFYFVPVSANDSNRILRILENDLILKHDCIWPHGLNFSLHIDSLLEVSEFRKSCLRHHWPPETDAVEEKEIDLNRLRRQVASYAACSPDKPFAAHVAADQNHRGDAAAAQDDTDSDKSAASKKQSKQGAATKATRPTSSSAPRATAAAAAAAAPSPSKPPTEKASSSSSSKPSQKSSPTKPTSKPTQQAAEHKEIEQRTTDENNDSTPDNETASADHQPPGAGAVPTLNRSNTFTYSDSDSSEGGGGGGGGGDQTKEKSQKTPTRQGAAAASSSGKGRPQTASSQRN